MTIRKQGRCEQNIAGVSEGKCTVLMNVWFKVSENKINIEKWDVENQALLLCITLTALKKKTFSV